MAILRSRDDGKPFIEPWDAVRQISKPIVAAVSGWCLGGGCELAMICDTIIASESAKVRSAGDRLGTHS